MNITTLQTALFNWANRALNPEWDAIDPVITTIVYWGDTTAPRPANPSLRLKLIGGPTQVGIDGLRDAAGDDAFTIVGERTLILSITAYGDDAMQIVSNLITSIADPDLYAVLEAAKVAIMSFSPVRDLSELLETKFEQRYQIDANLGVMEDSSVEPGVIESVVVESTIPESDGTGDFEGGFESP